MPSHPDTKMNGWPKKNKYFITSSLKGNCPNSVSLELLAESVVDQTGKQITFALTKAESIMFKKKKKDFIKT